jgi:hypothetical protein
MEKIKKKFKKVRKYGNEKILEEKIKTEGKRCKKGKND